MNKYIWIQSKYFLLNLQKFHIGNINIHKKMKLLEGKVALITGGNGIGKEL